MFHTIVTPGSLDMDAKLAQHIQGTFVLAELVAPSILPAAQPDRNRVVSTYGVVGVAAPAFATALLASGPNACNPVDCAPPDDYRATKWPQACRARNERFFAGAVAIQIVRLAPVRRVSRSRCMSGMACSTSFPSSPPGCPRRARPWRRWPASSSHGRARAGGRSDE